MKVIFDENVPLPLRQFFVGHEVTSVQLEGWTGVENGAIIDHVEGRFDVLLLADKNLRYQQNLTGRKVALVELPTNRWPILRQMAERIVEAVSRARPGDYIILEVG
ncbi:MAG: hypothetical protein WC661_16895 [Opitutaceae bacterium]|jgi:hypothetical protein